TVGRRGGSADEFGGGDMLTKVLACSLYGLFAAGYFFAGGTVLLLGTGLLPAALRDGLVEGAEGNLGRLQVVQGFGSLLVFAGLMAVWSIWRYDESRPCHWAMTIFWGLMALIHWFDISGPWESPVGPAITTVPFVLFLLVGLLRVREE